MVQKNEKQIVKRKEKMMLLETKLAEFSVMVAKITKTEN